MSPYPFFRKQKQKSRKTQGELVLGALKQGAKTSMEISSITGLSIKVCSAVLNELRLAGVVRIVHKDWVRFDTSKGRRFHEWALM